MYMQRNNIRIFEAPRRKNDTHKYPMKRPLRYTICTLEREAMEILDTVETPSIVEGAVATMQREEQATSSEKQSIEGLDTTSARTYDVLQEVTSIEAIDTIETLSIVDPAAIDTIDTHKLDTQQLSLQTSAIEAIDTQELPSPSPEKDSIASVIS